MDCGVGEHACWFVDRKGYLLTGKEFTKGDRCRVTADMPPDVALPEIFDCYMIQANDGDDYLLKVEGRRGMGH